MNNISKEELEKKQAIFDKMPKKRQEYILKKGFENWDPFQDPQDPIDLRKDKTQRTTQMLVREFLQSKYSKDLKQYSNAYGNGVLEICLGIINNNDKYLGMYEFSCWYKKLLENEKILEK